MRFSTVALTASSLDAVEEFYGRTLELPLARSAGACTVQIGGTELRFVPFGAGAATHPVNHLAITVPRNQFAEARHWLQSRTAVIELDGESGFALGEPWHSDSVYFLGPDGIVLEFIARQGLPNDRVEPFGPGGMLLVSEVGLAVPSGQEAVAELAAELGLERFAGVSASFAAVGTADALLIVVDDGRTWFPTADAAASAAPLQIELVGAPRAGRYRSGLGATVAARA
ncbi:VOC family protein [Microterricola pindariensis]|uniref:VOC domain-containing protein n=1 Tax=Microterricola pindariensis TaxID=478010 RepID=A0ABX5AT24_9MICO|nr:hypothetical protein [Microterricola pindariensis]PPL14631.1 hypothetical protein GY24_15855 [Microterricola pindariensis]